MEEDDRASLHRSNVDLRGAPRTAYEAGSSKNFPRFAMVNFLTYVVLAHPSGQSVMRHDIFN